MPFPGRKWPTRVAWAFEMRQSTEQSREIIARVVSIRQRQTGRSITSILRDADVQALGRTAKVRRLQYVGKPNRYRAVQAQRFLQRTRGEQLVSALEVEFDRGGVLYSRLDGGAATFDDVHVAYHPHSGTLGPVDAFARKVHCKRVGGLTLYSYKDKLSQEELDAFYVWYEKRFKKRLRRPKGRALAMKEAPGNDPTGEEVDA